MNTNKIITVFLLAIFVLTSCKKDFIELNTNPNSTQSALPQNLLGPSITELAKTNISICSDVSSELTQVHMQVVVRSYSTFRFDISPALSTDPYNDLYMTLGNFKDMYQLAVKAFELDNSQTYHKTYMGIALICEVLNASILTDMFGNIPYSEAGKAKDRIFLPKFDAQKDIYLDFYKKLEEANTLLALNNDLPSDQVVADPLYNGVALNWRKFGNSLYLRLLLRASNKPEVNAAVKIKEIAETNSANYPLISSNSGSAILRLTGTAPSISPLSLITDANYGQKRYTNFFLDNLKAWGDPRITKWASLVGGQYTGMPSGFAEVDNPKNGSNRLLALKKEPLMGNFLNYSEVQFMLAEAAVKRWISDNAQSYYETGVRNHIELWGLAFPTNYFNTSAKWDNEVSAEQKLEKIYLQKYYALFYTDLQQWSEYRRTGYPAIPLTGGGLTNNKKVPNRLNYPPYLQHTNGANLSAAISMQGPDDLNTKMWWQNP